MGAGSSNSSKASPRQQVPTPKPAKVSYQRDPSPTRNSVRDRESYIEPQEAEVQVTSDATNPLPPAETKSPLDLSTSEAQRQNSWPPMSSDARSPVIRVLADGESLQRENSWEPLEDRISPDSLRSDTPNVYESARTHSRAMQSRASTRAKTNLNWGDDENTEYGIPDEDEDVYLPSDVAEEIADLQKCIARVTACPSLNGSTTQYDINYIKDKFIMFGKDISFCKKVLQYKFIEMEQKVWGQILTDELFTPAKTTIYEYAEMLLTCLWHLTEPQESGQIALHEIAKLNFHQDLVKYLGQEPFKANKLSQTGPRTLTVKAFLDILHRMARNVIGRKDDLRKFNTVDALQSIRECSNPTLASTAFLIQSHLVNEKENEKYNSKPDTFHMAYKILDSAMKKTPYHIETLFREEEVMEALNRLASMDANVDRMLDAKIDKLYLYLTKSSDDQLVFYAIKGLWMMMYKGRQRMQSTGTAKRAIDKVSQKDEELIKKGAEGATWIYENKLQQLADDFNKERKRSDRSKGGFIYVSYYPGDGIESDKRTRKLIQTLEKRDFTVRTGKDESLENRTQLIELAAVVLICITESYKESPLCRLEAEYTALLKTPFLPLKMMDNGYESDGWVAKLQGDKAKYNFNNDKATEEVLQDLKQFQPKGSKKTVHPDRALSSLSSGRDSRAGVIPYCWTKEEVDKWFADEKLTDMKSEFPDMDGPMLGELLALWDEAPDSYYKKMFKTYNTAQVLRFTKSLRELKKRMPKSAR